MTNSARVARDLRGAADVEVEEILKDTVDKVQDEEKAGVALVGHLDVIRPEEQTKEEGEARRKEEEERHEEQEEVMEENEEWATDDVSGVKLDPKLVKRARAVDMEHVRSKGVWTKIRRKDAEKRRIRDGGHQVARHKQR